MTPQNRQEAERAADLSTFIAFMTLFGSVQQVMKNRMQAQAEQGLGPLHLRALCLCLDNPQATQQQLVQQMGKDKGQIARLVQELQARDCLVRTPDERDRRVWRLAVTPEGAEKCRWFLAIEGQLATDLLGGLGLTQREQLAPLLAQLHERVHALADPA